MTGVEELYPRPPNLRRTPRAHFFLGPSEYSDSTHAKYMLQASVVKAVVHFRRFLFEMGLTEDHCSEATIVDGDNNVQAAILAMKPKVTTYCGKQIMPACLTNHS